MNKIFTIILTIIATIAIGCASIPKEQLLGHNIVQSAGLKFEPGAVVSVEKQNPFDGNVVCSSKDALGDEVKLTTNTIEHHTVTTNAFMGTVNEIFSGKNAASSNNVYTNIRVQTISDTEVVEHAQNGKFSPACVNAIDRNLKAGKPLAMINSVMIGDAETKTSNDSAAAGRKAGTTAGAQKTSSTATASKDHKIGVKFSQMQLTILTEEMKISVDPRDISLPIQLSL